MARKYAEEMSCDICGTTSRVDSFTIVSTDGASVIDLCRGDSKDLRKLWDAGSTEPRRRETAKRSGGHSVTPVD